MWTALHQSYNKLNWTKHTNSFTLDVLMTVINSLCWKKHLIIYKCLTKLLDTKIFILEKDCVAVSLSIKKILHSLVTGNVWSFQERLVHVNHASSTANFPLALRRSIIEKHKSEKCYKSFLHPDVYQLAWEGVLQTTSRPQHPALN